MSELGISIYPSKSTFQEMAAYLDQTASLGYTRIFTSMLEVADNPDETVQAFKAIIAHGNKLGMRTSLDANPKLFKALNLGYEDMSFFADLGIWSLRLDEGFRDYEEAMMTHNPYGIIIETNISRGQHYIDLIMDFGANKDRLIGSHNFYPQAYTGLDLDYFVETAAKYKAYNLRTAAFVDTASGKFGPWPLSDLMVSSEVQRNLPLTTQIQLLKATGVIDDLFISSSLVDIDDLKAAAASFFGTMPELQVQFREDTSSLEKTICLDNIQLYRGDYSGYMIRSSQTRVTYRNESVPAANTAAIQRGDILIGNDQAGQYKAELQVALKDRPNLGERQNVIGHIREADLILLDWIQPWQSFRLVEGK